MKKRLVYLLYKLFRPYISVDRWQSPTSLHYYFTLRIFGERISEIEYSLKEMVERIIL